jgi:hypothetical protein
MGEDSTVGQRAAAEATEGPVPAAVVERALARLGHAGDLLHDVLAPQERGLDPGTLPGESWHMLGEALEALGRAERLLRVGLARPGGSAPGAGT